MVIWYKNFRNNKKLTDEFASGCNIIETIYDKNDASSYTQYKFVCIIIKW